MIDDARMPSLKDKILAKAEVVERDEKSQERLETREKRSKLKAKTKKGK